MSFDEYLDENPYAPPSSQFNRVKNPPKRVHFEFAGLGRRFAALLIDTVVLVSLGIVLAIIYTTIALATVGPGQRENVSPYTRFITLSVRLLYFAVLESSAWQATIGKRVLGCKVVDLDGQRISFGQAAGRYFAKIVSALTLGLGFLMAGFTEKNQALHDKIAGTLVIRTP